MPADSPSMTIRKPTNRILWYEGIGFGLLIGLTWLDFLLPAPGLMLRSGGLKDKGEDNLFISGLIAIVGVLVMVLTKRLVDRLHRLEGLLQVCAWCGRICDHGQWMSVEEYFAHGFKITTSHGVCPDCSKKIAAECPHTDLPPPSD